MREIEVDKNKCIGCGLCVDDILRIAPKKHTDYSPKTARLHFVIPTEVNPRLSRSLPAGPSQKLPANGIPKVTI